MAEIKRFRYHASTVAVSGHFTLPFQEDIPAQACLSLKEAGGFLHTHVNDFNFRDIVTFRRALAFTAGSFSPKDQAFDATATVLIEGLNILNVVTADRIVARVASSHPKSGEEPGITPIGCCFEGLRIAGHPVQIELAVDIFAKFRTMSSFREACDRDGESARLLTAADHTKSMGLAELPCTLVRSIRGLGSELELISPNKIRIRDFGVLTLGAISVAERKRTVSMLQFELGSTPEGAGQIGGAEGNGTGN